MRRRSSEWPSECASSRIPTSRRVSRRSLIQLRRCSCARSTTGPATGAGTWLPGSGLSRAARCSGRWGFRRPAAGLSEVSPERVAELFRIGGETVADPERRAALWRNLAAGLERDHGGDAEALLAVCDGRL